MKDLVDNLAVGYEKYYNTLMKLGYASSNAVNKLIVATWINDVLMGRYDIIINERQYKTLENLYMCMEGSCFVPYTHYCKIATVNKRFDRDYIRTTENNRERLLQSGNLRTL